MQADRTTHGHRDDLFHSLPEGAAENGQVTEGEQTLWQQLADAATPAAYYQAWLALQCQMIAGVSHGVVVLGAPDRGPFAPAAFWPVVPHNRQHLAEVAERALLERHGCLLVREVSEALGIPRHQRYHMAFPIQIAGHLHGVVAVEIAPCAEAQLPAVMRHLQWGVAWLEVFFQRQCATSQIVQPERPQAVLEIVATILEQERFQAAATAFVTELATRLACDRVSLGFVRRGQVQIRALSHSAQFGKKTNLTRAIAAAMDEAFDQEAVLVYPLLPGATFQILQAHAILVRQHGAGAVCSLPLSYEGRVVGVLTLERPADVPFDRHTIELCEAVAAFAGPILEVQRRDDRWLPAKAVDTGWRQLGRLFGARYLGRKLALVVLTALLIGFAVARAEYRVTATSGLEPAIRRAVVAPFDGFIADAPARAGDLVRAGEVLCALDDRDLKLERLKWRSQKEQYAKQYQQAMAQRNAALAQIVAAQMAQADAELALVEEHLARARVPAPFDGIVVVGDLRQMIGAPVERGHVLFEVAPLETYRLILQVDEREVAEVRAGQQGHLVLSAFPTEALPFTVEMVTPVSTAREGRNYFRVEAQLADTPARLRPGMEGIGKIAIDRRLLVWIWTHQALDWVRLTLWSWWP